MGNKLFVVLAAEAVFQGASRSAMMADIAAVRYETAPDVCDVHRSSARSALIATKRPVPIIKRHRQRRRCRPDGTCPCLLMKLILNCCVIAVSMVQQDVAVHLGLNLLADLDRLTAYITWENLGLFHRSPLRLNTASSRIVSAKAIVKKLTCDLADRTPVACGRGTGYPLRSLDCHAQTRP